MNRNKQTLLDCTFRDGGYYNQWDFSDELIELYLSAMDDANIDVIEIGFRFLPKKEFLGSLAYSSDEFLNSLTLPKKTLIGVMVNAKELLNYKDGPEAAVRFLFNEASESPIGLVRIAAHFDEYEKCLPLVQELSMLGYRVGFNLMQAGGKTHEEISKAAKVISTWTELEVLYFADSLGNMNSNDVISIIDSLRSGGWNKSIGIHTHDNKGEALNNTLAAMDAGVDWLDCTILGMGRGPGNARTEYLLIELIQRGIEDYSPDSIFQIVLKEFSQLKDQYGWGPNLLYYLSADYGVHPTYVQEMSSMLQVDTHNQISALKYLGKSKASVYSKKSLEDSFLTETSHQEGNWSCDGWLKDRVVLLLGSGPGTKKYSKEVARFIQKNNPKVISLNVNSNIESSLIDAYAACHHTRVLMDFSMYLRLKKPLIMPLHSIPNELKERLKGVDILDYGMGINRNKFEFNSNSCTIPKPLVIAYLLALINAAGGKRILLAGFDGFSSFDPRQLEMEEMLSLYSMNENSIGITAITPSTYSVDKSSVFNPKI